MPKVIVTQLYQREIEVEVTEAQLAAMRTGGDGQEEAQQFVVDTAIELADTVELEWAMTTATEEDGMELFSIG